MNRKILLGLVSIALLVHVTSCFGPSKQEIEEQTRLDSIAVADSVAAVRKAEAKRVSDSLRWVNFKSPDLTFFELHGHVKTVSYGKDEVIEFSRDGKFIKDNGRDPFRTGTITEFESPDEYKRNAQGYISEVGGWEWGTEYFWADGRVVKESGGAEAFEWEYLYHYDSNGLLVSLSGTEGEFEEPKTSVKYTVTYSEFDEYGNWTKRHVSSGRNTQRSITYYERE